MPARREGAQSDELGWPGAGRRLGSRHGAGARPECRRVLLAEGDDDMRRLLASALRAEGFAVRAVRGGAELLNRIGALLLRGRLETSVDLIVSDLRISGIDGLKVLAGLRRANWTVPFILITAFGDERSHAEARGLGAAVLDKPFQMAELVSLARSLPALGR